MQRKQLVTRSNFDKWLLLKNMYYYKLSIWCISYDILKLTFQSGIPNVNQGSFYFMIKLVHVFEVMVEGLPDPTLRTNYHIFFEEN